MESVGHIESLGTQVSRNASLGSCELSDAHPHSREAPALHGLHTFKLSPDLHEPHVDYVRPKSNSARSDDPYDVSAPFGPTAFGR